jgi:hypothetical protein
VFLHPEPKGLRHPPTTRKNLRASYTDVRPASVSSSRNP